MMIYLSGPSLPSNDIAIPIFSDYDCPHKLHKVKSMFALCPAIQYASPPKKRGQQYRHVLESGHVYRC